MSNKDDLTAFTNAVKKEAEGRWRHIYMSLCPSMHLAVQTSDRKKSAQVPDPITGEGKTRFRLIPRQWETHGGGIMNPDDFYDGWRLLMECNGWSFWDAICEVGELLGVKRSLMGLGSYTANTAIPKAAPPPKEIQPDYEAMEKHKQRMVKTWKQTFPLSHPSAEIARKYLSNRGLMYLEKITWVRFHPNCYRWHEDSKLEKGGYATFEPAIICAMMSPDGKTINLHRTYLTTDGYKAAGEDNKSMMAMPEGFKSNGACTLIGVKSLDDLSDLVMVCEGLETGLAVYQQYKVPVLVCHTAGLLHDVIIPEHVNKVIIMADRDNSKTGKNMAVELKARLIDEGKKATWGAPGSDCKGGEKGADWNDVLKEGAKWPSLQRILSIIA